jgi:hypothetical protein
MKVLGYPFYYCYVITGKRARVRRQLRTWGLPYLEELRKDIAKRIGPNFEDMINTDDFGKVVAFLGDRFQQFSREFVSIFQSGDCFHDWVIRLGVYVGDLVIRHSINKAQWIVDDEGLLVVQFERDAGPFRWSPFEFVERRYFFGEPEDFFLSLDIFRKLKC